MKRKPRFRDRFKKERIFQDRRRSSQNREKKEKEETE